MLRRRPEQDGLIVTVIYAWGISLSHTHTHTHTHIWTECKSDVTSVLAAHQTNWPRCSHKNQLRRGTQTYNTLSWGSKITGHTHTHTHTHTQAHTQFNQPPFLFTSRTQSDRRRFMPGSFLINKQHFLSFSSSDTYSVINPQIWCKASSTAPEPRCITSIL